MSDPSCKDTPDWTDSEGDTCDRYAAECTQRGGWQSVVKQNPEFFVRKANSDGVTAQDACCKCGKGAARASATIFFFIATSTHLSECASLWALVHSLNFHQQLRAILLANIGTLPTKPTTVTTTEATRPKPGKPWCRTSKLACHLNALGCTFVADAPHIMTMWVLCNL